MQSPKQLARIGIFYLEEAVLDVLFEAMAAQEASFVRAVDIRKKVGIDKEWDRDQWLIRSILEKLKMEERVQPRIVGKQQRGWKLTEAEYEKRR